MTASLVERVRRTIRRYGLIPPGARIAVAVSGGADSVALLRLLRVLAAEDSFVLAGIAHLNHALRGADAEADEAFCRSLASALALPIAAETVDVARRARETRRSIEHAAHDARHEFFCRAAERLGASCVAVGHTRDDQAETFLLRLLRGAGPRGLAGIHPRAGLVVRPLLECAREELRRSLQDEGVEFREDATNADVRILRNRVRHELLPLLRDRFTSGVVAVLDREATIAREDAAFLDAAAADAAARLTVSTGAGVEIQAEALLAQPPALARRVLRDAQRVVSGLGVIGFDAVDALWQFAMSGSPGPIDFPGHRAERVAGRIVLSRRARGRSRPAGTAGFEYRLDIPGRVSVPEAACEISAETAAASPGGDAGLGALRQRGDTAVLDAACLRGPLAVRSRQPGDLFRPLGLSGHKKLQDFFVDRKVRRAERDTVPLIVDNRGLIVWVCGYGVAEDARVTGRTGAVVVLKMNISGGGR